MTEDLRDWRLLLNRIHATFVAPTMPAAAALVAQIVAIADADVDLRPPGVVHVSLPSDDAASAGAISDLAASARVTSEPGRPTVAEVAIDAMDIPRIKPFWKAVLGYDDDGDDALADPLRIGAPFWFQQMHEPRTQRGRFHIDVTVPHDRADVRVAAALEAGGTLVTDRFARSWWVLADAEGNEACVCTWQDRA
jgi:4a-hydroxytetrahydrobiopterin dehydratase